MDYTDPENRPKKESAEQQAESDTTNPYTPGVQEPLSGKLTSDDKTWGLLAHISVFAGSVIPFGNIIAPLVIWQMYKEKSEFVTAHAKESLNFQISITIYILILGASGLILCFPLALIPIVGIFGIVISIMAAIKANKGEYYQCPLCIRLIK